MGVKVDSVPYTGKPKLFNWFLLKKRTSVGPDPLMKKWGNHALQSKQKIPRDFEKIYLIPV